MIQELQRETEDTVAAEQGLSSGDDVYQNMVIDCFADSKRPENKNKSRDMNVLPC